MRTVGRSVTILVVVSLLAGCSGGGGPANRRPTKPVKVTVTYKGKPVADAIVTFVNQEGEAAPAYGKTDAQGVAKIKTYVEGDGAVPGPHKVTITKTETSGGGSTTSQSSPDYVPPGEGGTPVPTVKHLIPEKYGLLATSNLTADVKEGKNEITFDLTD